ncbi:MAG TPA: hypothetical protein VJU86_03345 [Pyrinomonadaceae bacterium]|nr:hypothetical protein [Pyrinomonadaceae bacterium]
MVSEELEDSLRREIESYVEGRLGGIRQEIAALQSQLNESLSRLLDSQSEMHLDGGVASSILEHLRAAHEEGIDVAASESARTKASSDMAKVKAAISEIDGQDSQAEILKTLINRASSFAPRVAFFVIKGDQSMGWRARGFEGTVGDGIIQQVSFPVSADTAVGSVARSRETWSGGPGSHSEDHMLLNRLGDEPPVRIVAVPLVVRQRTVAVMYADSSNLDSEAINLEALETLVKVSSMAVELLASRSGTAKASAPAPAVEEQPKYAPVAEYDEISPVVEESAPPAEPVYAEPTPEAVEVEPPAYEVTPAPAEIEAEAPTREATPYQEPSPVYEVETTPPATVDVPPSPVTETAPPPAAPRRRYGADAELPIEVANDEERRLHNDARRFARLLVSEIKLYNERQVVEGREQNDLYVRLREYIDRSREMYDKRVKPDVAQKFDYFHHELVNTLAEGDMAKLGSGYPGTTVSA